MADPFPIIAFILLGLYSFLILAFFSGWLIASRFTKEGSNPSIRVSILIPCRNEKDNIQELFHILEDQDYPTELLEVIWIDDHSSDGTGQILENLIQKKNNNRLLNLEGRNPGKKEALKAGMEQASGELILLTDADSRPGRRWVQSMAKMFRDNGNDLILGPVVIDPVQKEFDQFQKLEYLSLVAASIGASGIGSPIMAQGPNIAVRADDYRIIVNDLDNRYASGDDVFLLQAMKKMPGKKIGYLMDQDAIIHTKPVGSLTAFMQQRSRWASKARGYRDPVMLLTAILVFAANLAIMASLVLAATGTVPFILYFILAGIKFLADLPLLLIAMRFFRSTNLLLRLLPSELFYPAYTVITGILSQIIAVRWKNVRKLRT